MKLNDKPNEPKPSPADIAETIGRGDSGDWLDP
jgi:hypothetical protein